MGPFNIFTSQRCALYKERFPNLELRRQDHLKHQQALLFEFWILRSFKVHQNLRTLRLERFLLINQILEVCA